MILKFLRQSTRKPYFLLFVLVIVGFTFTCKEYIPVLNKNPEADFCWKKVEYGLRVDFFAEDPPLPDGEVFLSSDGQPCKMTLDGDEGKIVSYLWDFGDGTTAEGGNTFHIFQEEKKYYVELTVVDDDDAIDTVIKEIDVYNINRPPDAVLYTNSLSNTESINFVWAFNGSGSSDADGDIVNFKFVIKRRSDGKVIAEYDNGMNNTLIYTFNKTQIPNSDWETFEIKLTVTDNRGTIDSDIIMIMVYE
jgi:hypothetical protein